MQALQVLAGPTALKRLRERGLQPQDIRAIPAAAGGPKGLVLNPLDRFLFCHWLPRGEQVVHLLGASIGAWRMASACLPDADAALAQLASDYIAQRYEHEPGKAPKPRHVSELFEAKLRERFGGREHEVLSHPRYRLHVFTSRGVRALARGRARAHAARLFGRVRVERRVAPRDGRVPGARDLFRPARPPARAHARLPHASRRTGGRTT